MGELAKRFMSLFRGNTRSFGRFYVKSGRLETIKGVELGLGEFSSHLSGKEGIGIVPIMDNGLCYFGAIDIDTHEDNEPDTDLVELEKKVRGYDLPLSVCRSKGGGAHLYLFGTEPLKASLVRTALTKWAELLGYGGTEIFPKQSKILKDENGDLLFGTWLNLCYFDAESKAQLRYSIEGGKQVPLEYFLDLAESRKVSGAVLVERSDTDHNGAPPCIQKMISGGVGAGYRNQALYNVVIYLRKAYPETWKDKAFDLNAKIFDSPLAHLEAKKTIASAGRRDYRYKCKEEPCRSLCNSSVCITRKFGITPDEKNELTLGKPPEFQNLRKVTTDPVKWLMAVDGNDIVLSTIELVDFRKVREAIADRLTKLVAPMKNDTWQSILYPLMESAAVIIAPDEASTAGIIRAKLNSFVLKADLNSDGTNLKDRETLNAGSPVVQIRKENDSVSRVVYFRGQDFVDFLKKNRSEELKGSALWMVMRDAGVGHCKLRIGSKSSIQAWYVPITADNDIEFSRVEIKNEF